MRTIQILGCIAVAVVLASVSTSRGDGDGTGGDEEPPPITGEPVMPKPGSEQPMKDPFAPYDIGRPESAWPYETLTAEEKAVVDRGRDDDQSDVLAAYGEAIAAIAVQAKADAAAIHLGIDTSLDEIGVVP